MTENMKMEATEIKSETQVEMQKTESVQEPVTTPIPEKLNQQQALQVLVDAAKIAQSKGIFTLDDAELVNKAIRAFVAPQGPVATGA